ncbi:probable cytochrome P450 9f2 isoform X2 [Eupeodes corollae]|uniref:probable cytochrome P450 9f2 isoform X2 n=1 Tax=Eupeodes corollae TaxID=290404 RepID=UPI0024926D0C|nr:probable cytochrome P450 9f2 isoform X2 [Eupeodes corollae]
MLIEFIILLGLALFIFYKWSTSTFDFFEKIGIPYDKPFPLFGSQKDIVLRKSSMYDNVNRLYKQFNTSVSGFFDNRTPVFLIRDPAIMKRITVKDFDHFINHRQTFDENDGGLFGNSLFVLKNDKWKDMRSTVSPVFTGNKMRQMFILINEVAKESIDFLKLKCENQNEIDFSIKDFLTKFTNDTIASAVFGLKVNSFKEEQNEFYQMGKRVTKFTAIQNIKFFLFTSFKPIVRLLKIELFDKKDSDYFLRLVLDAMKYREQNRVMRPDMVNMMMEAKGIFINKDNDKQAEHKPSTDRKWTDVEIVAQFFLFFFAGFETTAVMMAFAVMELMQNPDCQDKLRQEVVDVTEALDGEPLSYEALHGMKYMDMVLSETLRRWPPAVATDRLCNKDFSYKDNDLDLTIKSGDTVLFPVVGFHLDENYFPDPLKFDPERFSDENKGNIKPFTYLPFGVGPRNCIGNRFALLEAKAILFYIVKNFRLEVSPKSTVPIVLSSSGFNLEPKGGWWVKLVPLEN